MPITRLYRDIWPFLIILGAAGVLLITYLPWLSLGAPALVGPVTPP